MKCLKNILLFQMTSLIHYTTDVKYTTPLAIPPLRLSHHVSVSEWKSLNSGRNFLQKERIEEGQKKVSAHSNKEFSKGSPLGVMFFVKHGFQRSLLLVTHGLCKKPPCNVFAVQSLRNVSGLRNGDSNKDNVIIFLTALPRNVRRNFDSIFYLIIEKL